MGANRRWAERGRTATAGFLLTGFFAVSAAGAMLPTGHMLTPHPKGPAREDLPARTSTGPYRIPTKVAYGLVGPNVSPRPTEHIVRISADSPDPKIETKEPGSVTIVAAPEPKTAPMPRTSTAPVAAQDSPIPTRNALAPVCQAFVAVCPVTLRDDRRPVAPKAQFSSVFEGQRYRFASAEAQATFDANPKRYAPARSGMDVVLAAQGKPNQPGSLKYAGFYRNRLYLFQSQQTADAFTKNPAKFAGEQ